MIATATAQTPPPPAPRPPDVSVTTVGAQTWSSSALAGATDVDLTVGERLRWTLAGAEQRGGTDVLALADLRATLDANGELPEWVALRQLAAEVDGERFLLDLGRTPVFRGGPRLVDGVQLLYEPSVTVDVGFWAGAAPDVFTTLPRARFGGGPILSYASSRLQASLVGDVLLFQGEVDRAGVLGMVRAAAERTLEGSARVDVELAGDAPRLVDGQLVGIAQPFDALRADVLYNAFSAYKYVASETLDPDLTRFDARLAALAQLQLLDQGEREEELNHLLGASARLQPDTDGAAPRVGVAARYRLAPDANDTYARLNPQLGVVGVAQRLDVLADANLFALDEGTQVDAGLVVVLEPVVEGPIAFDASVRATVAPDVMAGPGWYADLFADIVSEELELLLTAGFSVATEPDVDQQDNAYGAYVSLSKYLRPTRRPAAAVPSR